MRPPIEELRDCFVLDAESCMGSSPGASPLRRTLLPPAHLHTNKELAEWYISQGRRVVMPRRTGQGCEEIGTDYDWANVPK